MSQGEGGGRPTEYKVTYNEQARKLCLLGSTDKEMADFFNVAESTINLWKLTYPKFSESINKGKSIADANVANSLYKRANGYSHPDVDIKVIEGQIVKTSLTKHYAPDTAAGIFWLKNRQKKKWRDKIETGFTDDDGNDRTLQIIQLPDNGRSQRADHKSATGLSNEDANLPG